jgi:hypothetical protein
VPEATIDIDSTSPAARRRLTHAEDPDRPGVALCGTRLTRRPAPPAGERCAVCLDLTRRHFLGR